MSKISLVILFTFSFFDIVFVGKISLLSNKAQKSSNHIFLLHFLLTEHGISTGITIIQHNTLKSCRTKSCNDSELLKLLCYINQEMFKSRELLKTSPRKLPNHMECPFDTILYTVIEPLSRFFHILNFTPNMLTTISTIFGAMSFYFLYKRKEGFFVISFISYYLFDCLDGYYARKYGLCSKFGDYYDHIKDFIVAFLVIGLIFYRLHKSRNYKAMILLGLGC